MHMAEETATFARRLMAYNIDLTALMLIILPISLFIESNRILYVVCIAVIILYHAIFESSPWQGTPGKRQGRMVVESESGYRLSLLQATCRILLKFLSLLLLFGGYFMIYLRADRKGLHDLICHTRVRFTGG